ncbi:MAG: ABC transporter substrate-binding protein [Deltaproteobacteria bacterium]|nr:ABC transporter substrate-binding protein [Deltaproteobacteria bacterium]
MLTESNRWIAALGLFLSLSIFPAAFAQDEKPEKERIRIGYSVQSTTFSIPFLAIEAGLFRDEGMQVEFIRTPGSLAPMVLISQDVDFSIMSAFLLIPAAVRHGDPVMLGGFSTRFTGTALISRPEIRTAKELRGKIVGVQRPGDAVERNARFALRHLGLDPDRDVKLIYFGNNEVLWSALETNRAAAAILSPPRTVWARRAGMNLLVNIADLKIDYQGAALTTRRAFMRNHPNVTLRTVRALVRGVHFFKSRQEETLGILAKFFRTNDREALEELWRLNSPAIPAKPYASEPAVQAVINHLAEADARYAQHKAVEFIDSGPLSDLDRSGYIDRLYAGQEFTGKSQR